MNTKNKYLLLFLLALIMTACSAPAPTPTASPVDPATIAQGFWDAIIAKNTDAAMAYLADDVQIIGGPASVYNKVDFSALMASVSETNTYEISDVKTVSGDTATYTGKVYVNGTLQGSGYAQKMQVRDGKIILIELP